ncbi:hypothetical protein CDAR_200611 [Caerostris darwini]|uniref:Uncharacterized protein n=1 Tax=Caerostris darwini TaxID=1538125 RepID=A0AAV4TZX8_9ARAC|nr:hypothetical protein CDAR_200611 [Caerostris darwini]
MDFRSFSWNATKNCDSISRRDTSKKRHSPAKQDLQSKKWTSDPSAGILRKIVTASQGETPPRRDILQQNRIFNRRNGLQILQLECYKNCDSVSRRDTSKKETISSKTGSSIEEMDFKSFSWNATKNCDSVSRRDTSKKRHSPPKQDLQSKKWTSDPSAGILRKIVTASQGETPPRRDILQQNMIFNRRNGLQILQLECYQKL